MEPNVKHTPGPWYLLSRSYGGGGGGREDVWPHRNLVFSLQDGPKEEATTIIAYLAWESSAGRQRIAELRANASLLAAAPELLASLKEMVEWSIWDTDYRARALAAIAKAEGR